VSTRNLLSDSQDFIATHAVMWISSKMWGQFARRSWLGVHSHLCKLVDKHSGIVFFRRIVLRIKTEVASCTKILAVFGVNTAQGVVLVCVQSCLGLCSGLYIHCLSL